MYCDRHESHLSYYSEHTLTKNPNKLPLVLLVDIKQKADCSRHLLNLNKHRVLTTTVKLCLSAGEMLQKLDDISFPDVKE